MAQSQLTTKQKKAVAALLSSRNVVDAAQVANVGKRSLYRWLKLPIFRRALLEAEGEAIDRATRRLIGLQDEVIDTLESILDDHQASATIRLRVTQIVLDNLLKLRELRNVEERITSLEKEVYDKRNH